jgi:hypothetical protein
MDLGGRDTDVVQQRLKRHAGITPWIVGRDATLVSPEKMYFLPGNLLSQRLLSEQFIGSFWCVSPCESNDEPAAGFNRLPRLNGNKFCR